MWPYIDIRVGLNEQNVILGYTNYSGNNDLINFIFLIVKRHIYVQRCKEKILNIVLFISTLKTYFKTEDEISKHNYLKATDKHRTKWNPLKALLDIS